MFLRQVLVGGDRNFSYVVGCETTREAVVIDPGYKPELLLHILKEEKLSLRYILNTHRHQDHSGGNAVLEKATGLKALAYGDKNPDSGKRMIDQAILSLGALSIEVLHTPGHTDDSTCFLIDDALFTGDTLFVGKVGGTDLAENARIQYHSLHEVLGHLPDHVRVFPGHNVGVRPESTIGEEKKTNPFYQQPDFESFVNLKRNWLEYKKLHGID